MDGLSDWFAPEVWVALLYTGGFGLVFLEMFIPGWVAGTAGYAALALAVYVAWAGVSPFLSVALAMGGAVGIPFILRWGMNRAALKIELSAAAGYVAADSAEMERFVGKRGTAATVLRPSGAVEVDGKRYDARSERGVVEKGRPVEVVRIEGSEMVVKDAQHGTDRE